MNSFEARHQSLTFLLTERHSTEEPSSKLKWHPFVQSRRDVCMALNQMLG